MFVCSAFLEVIYNNMSAFHSRDVCQSCGDTTPTLRLHTTPLWRNESENELQLAFKKKYTHTFQSNFRPKLPFPSSQVVTLIKQVVVFAESHAHQTPPREQQPCFELFIHSIIYLFIFLSKSPVSRLSCFSAFSAGPDARCLPSLLSCQYQIHKQKPGQYNR